MGQLSTRGGDRQLERPSLALGRQEPGPAAVRKLLDRALDAAQLLSRLPELARADEPQAPAQEQRDALFLEVGARLAPPARLPLG